jgi:uncharacterized protein with ParB-like and HNH nuclease domain
MNIIPNIYNIKDILKFGPYKIPRFQRQFSWQSEQLSEFFEDIIYRVDNENEEPLYIGAFVFNNENKKTTGKLDIIDGQQRLIAITLLFVAIRDVCKSIGYNELKNGIQENYIEAKDDLNRRYFRVVFHTEEKNAFYDDYFLNIDHKINKKSNFKIPEQNKLNDAYKLFYDRINQRIKDFKENELKQKHLEKLKEIISEILAVTIEVDSEDVAYQVFETLNSKGLRLSQIDLLKNLILQKYKPDAEIDRARNIWDEQIIKPLECSKLQSDRFVRYYWLSKYKFISSKYLYKSIKQEISGYKEFLNELEKESIRYIRINRPIKEEFKKDENEISIYDSLRIIKTINIQQCDPLILAIYRCFENKKLSIVQLKNTIQLIEKFSFLFKMSGKSPSGIERIYSKFALLTESIVNSNEYHEKVLKELQITFMEKKPSYEEFEDSFINLNYSDNKDLCAIILDRINRGKYKLNKIDPLNFSIEHILPQNPNANWNLSPEDVKEYVHNIGNLTLIENNLGEKAGNKSIRDKCKHYKKSHFNMTKDLATLDYWDEVCINDRAKIISKNAFYKVWKL